MTINHINSTAGQLNAPEAGSTSVVAVTAGVASAVPNETDTAETLRILGLMNTCGIQIHFDDAAKAVRAEQIDAVKSAMMEAYAALHFALQSNELSEVDARSVGNWLEARHSEMLRMVGNIQRDAAERARIQKAIEEWTEPEKPETYYPIPAIRFAVAEFWDDELQKSSEKCLSAYLSHAPYDELHAAHKSAWTRAETLFDFKTRSKFTEDQLLTLRIVRRFLKDVGALLFACRLAKIFRGDAMDSAKLRNVEKDVGSVLLEIRTGLSKGNVAINEASDIASAETELNAANALMTELSKHRLTNEQRAQLDELASEAGELAMDIAMAG